MKIDSDSHRWMTWTLFAVVIAGMMLAGSYFDMTEFGSVPTSMTWLLPALVVAVPLAGFLLALRKARHLRSDQ